MPRVERGAPALQVRAEHPDAVELGLRRERPDDRGARGAVADQVLVRALDDADAVLGVGSSSTPTAPARPPTCGWSASTPLSMIATFTPAPVAPPHAHSRAAARAAAAP